MGEQIQKPCSGSMIGVGGVARKSSEQNGIHQGVMVRDKVR